MTLLRDRRVRRAVALLPVLLLAVPIATAAGRAARSQPFRKAAVIRALRTGSYETVPFFQSSFSYHGVLYPYQMVGTSPGQSGTSRVPVVLVPIDLSFGRAPAGGGDLDGSSVLAKVLASPLFASVRWPQTGDTGQYTDAVRRAEFWRVVRHRVAYHLLLDRPRVTRTVHIVVSGRDGYVQVFGGGFRIGIVGDGWWELQLERLLRSLNVSPRALTVFLTYNVLSVGNTTEPGLIGGIHAAISAPAASGHTAIYTYAWGSWGVDGEAVDFGYPRDFGADVWTLAHELAEWSNDPFGDSVVPEWSFSLPLTGQTCTNLLETADPLVLHGITVMRAGFTYHLQDEAFFSWFARQRRSEGYRGRYSFVGRLSAVPPACPTLPLL